MSRPVWMTGRQADVIRRLVAEHLPKAERREQELPYVSKAAADLRALQQLVDQFEVAAGRKPGGQEDEQ